MSECTHDCSSCSSNCGERQEPQSFLEPCNAMSTLGHVIAVVSGKGGVGKSTVTSSLAVQMNRLGKNVAIMDADITGPSIPKAFGIEGRAMGSEDGILPAITSTGIGLMSINLLLEHETDPVVWRGPVLGTVGKQFWNEVIWGDVDYLFVDMPPGTGDVPLTVFQSLPIDGIVIVTSPQELVSMIVEKAVSMAKLMNIPVLGIVENMSGFRCPECGAVHDIFGESHLEEVVSAHGFPLSARLPIDPQVAKLCDLGRIEELPDEYLRDFTAGVRSMCEEN